MTDQPKTLALDSSEWKALLLDNIARAHKAVNDSAGINTDGLSMLSNHMDRIKGIAAAWHASQPQPPAQEAAQNVKDASQGMANGAEAPVKRKGGWPAGKPRKKRNAPAQAVQ